MKPLAECLPAKSASTQPGTQPLTKSTATSTRDMAREKAKLLNDLIKQSFNVFNVFGVQPEAITDKVKAFMLVLDTATLTEISNAFEIWMRTRSLMPTPADISELVQEEKAHKRETLAKDSAKPRARTDMPGMPWQGKEWLELTARDKAELEHHLKNVLEPKQSAEYRKFLKAHCAYPI